MIRPVNENPANQTSYLPQGQLFYQQAPPNMQSARPAVYPQQLLMSKFHRFVGFFQLSLSLIGPYQMTGNYSPMPPQPTMSTQPMLPQQQGQYRIPAGGQPSTQMYPTQLPHPQTTVRFDRMVFFELS